MLRFGPGSQLPTGPASAAYGVVSLGAIFLVLGYLRRRRSSFSTSTPAPEVHVPDSEKLIQAYKCPLPVVNITSLAGFNYREMSPAKFRPFKPIYSLSMGSAPPDGLGIESCSPNDLILLDRLYPSRISLRKRIIQTQPTEMILHSSPASIPAVAELYTFVLQKYLPVRFPTHFMLSPSGTLFTNTITHDTHPIAPPPHTNPSDPAPALKILATTIEEDLMLLLPDSNGLYSLAAFACCFPSGAAPEKRTGLTLDEIHHAPAPGDRLSASMNRLFTKLRPGLENAVRRFNWSITTDDRLFALSGNHMYSDDEDDEPEDETVDPRSCRLRVERQVLWKLPGSHAAVLTVKTYMYTLAEVKAEGLGEELARGVEGMGEEVGKYKKRCFWGKDVIEYLRS